MCSRASITCYKKIFDSNKFTAKLHMKAHFTLIHIHEYKKDRKSKAVDLKVRGWSSNSGDHNISYLQTQLLDKNWKSWKDRFCSGLCSKGWLWIKSQVFITPTCTSLWNVKKKWVQKDCLAYPSYSTYTTFAYRSRERWSSVLNRQASKSRYRSERGTKPLGDSRSMWAKFIQSKVYFSMPIKMF